LQKKDYFYSNSPKEAIKLAHSLGFKEVLLIGGEKLNGYFIKQNLIDEMILNVESVVIGKGVNLFEGQDFEKKLKLESVKKINEKIIQLKYIIRK
ncbi:MAG: dihydrofolate reductase family protein, partial [Nanoarchaeota archaeon]